MVDVISLCKWRELLIYWLKSEVVWVVLEQVPRRNKKLGWWTSLEIQVQCILRWGPWKVYTYTSFHCALLYCTSQVSFFCCCCLTNRRQDPFTSKKIIAHFIEILYYGGLEPKPSYLWGMLVCLKRAPGRWFFWLRQALAQCFPGFSNDNKTGSAFLNKQTNKFGVPIFLLKTPGDSFDVFNKLLRGLRKLPNLLIVL